MKKPPILTAEKKAELAALAKKIDREEMAEIRAQGRRHLARHQRIKDMINRLKTARLERHLTLEEVSAKSGIGKANLSRLETATHPNPTIDTLLRVSDAIGFEVLR